MRTEETQTKEFDIDDNPSCTQLPSKARVFHHLLSFSTPLCPSLSLAFNRLPRPHVRSCIDVFDVHREQTAPGTHIYKGKVQVGE